MFEIDFTPRPSRPQPPSHASRWKGISPAWSAMMFACIALLIEVPLFTIYLVDPRAFLLVALLFLGWLWLPPLYLSVFPLALLGIIRATTAFRVGDKPFLAGVAALLSGTVMLLWIFPILQEVWMR